MKTKMLFAVAAVFALSVFVASNVQAQMQPSGPGDAYIARVMKAAPPAVVKSATIVSVEKNGTMRTLQQGTNGFTCMSMDDTPMCADKGAMLWMRAVMTHGTPPDVMGFAYMLAGDTGTSNTDPYAKARTADNHWVTTGPHVMVFGTGIKSSGYPSTPDADPAKPYVMWPNTPYAHLMIPVK